MKVTLLLIGTLCVLSGTAEDFDIMCASNPVMEAQVEEVRVNIIAMEEKLEKLEGIVVENNRLLKQLVEAGKDKSLDGKVDELKHITKTVEDKVDIIDGKTDELKQTTKTVENKIDIIDEKTDELKNTAREVMGMNTELYAKIDEMKNSTIKVEGKFEDLDMKMDELKNITKTVEGMVEEIDGGHIATDIGATVLYRSGNLRYYKVPVTFGTTMKEGAVPDTCQKLGMMAVCSGRDAGCEYNSGRCSVTPLSSECSSPMLSLSKLICNGNSQKDCPQVEGMFAYLKGWSGGAAGVVDGSYPVRGNDFVSQVDTQLYGFCVNSV